MEFNNNIPQLATDSRNWSTWHENVEMVIKSAGLYSYLDGTVSEPNRQLEATAKLILASGIPDSIFRSLLYLETTHDYYKYLTNRFDKSTVQPLQERLRNLEGCRDAEPQVAAHTQKTFDGACRKCGERGHKARECRTVSIESEEPRVEEKPTRSRRKPRCRTENPIPFKNPPEELLSTSLEEGRTQASDELNKVRNDEIETVKPMWMPHNKESGGEVHGVAKSHEEVARVDVEDGEVDETSRTMNDGEHQADTSTDETTAMTTVNPPADASAPSQPSILPEQRDGQDTTGNAGASVHQPNGAQTGSPQRQDGATTSVRNSAQSAQRANSTITDHQQRHEDAHVEDRGGSGTGDVESHGEVQGGGYGGGRGSSDGTTNNASDES